jgi:hypothetical protein
MEDKLYSYKKDLCGGITLISPFDNEEDRYLQNEEDVEVFEREIDIIEKYWQNVFSGAKNVLCWKNQKEHISNYIDNYFLDG